MIFTNNLMVSISAIQAVPFHDDNKATLFFTCLDNLTKIRERVPQVSKDAFVEKVDGLYKQFGMDMGSGNDVDFDFLLEMVAQITNDYRLTSDCSAFLP
jgi:hypothetical protein